MKFQKSLFLSIMLLCEADGWTASHKPEEFLKKIQGTSTEGQEIYRHFCGTCHNPNPVIKLGAPRAGVISDWDFRVKNKVNVVFDHTFEGFNSMPPRGGCFECSDEQLILAILEMMPDSLKKDIKINLRDHKKSIK